MSCRVLILLYERGLCYSRPIDTIVAPVGKSGPVLDLKSDIIFGDKGEAKINKFLNYIESIIISRYLR